MRLDAALVARGLARSRGQAHELIKDGGVRVNGVLATRPATPVSDADTLDAASDPWVSRAAHKLLGALDASRTTVAGRGLDVGSSTGASPRFCSHEAATRSSRSTSAPPSS